MNKNSYTGHCLLEIAFIELWVEYDLNERNLVYNLARVKHFSVKLKCMDLKEWKVVQIVQLFMSYEPGSPPLSSYAWYTTLLWVMNITLLELIPIRLLEKDLEGKI